MKAAVLGASGGIGQPLSLLLKVCPLIDELALFDVVNTPGVKEDLSHISTPAKITGFLKDNDGLKNALTGTDIVIIPAGIPRKPGMTRDDLFKINAGIVKELIQGVAEYCPKAFVLIISNPVNSTVPIAAEVLKAANVFDPKKLFGVTTLDILRAETFCQPLTGQKKPTDTVIPVIGGHSGVTIVPLFSRAEPAFTVPTNEEEYKQLIKDIQFGGDKVVEAKNGAGSATLSMAYAGYRFAERVIRAAKGEKGIVECTFVYLPGVSGGDEIVKMTGTDYFSTQVELGPSGAEKAINTLAKEPSQEAKAKNSNLDGLLEKEQALLKACYEGLATNIKTGVEFVQNPPQK